jgi:gliding motility associated protien GldN
MSRSLITFGFLILISGSGALAQGVLEAPRAWSTENQLQGNKTQTYISARKEIPYAHVREADVMWATRIWRVIDLREKINHPFYFPKTRTRDRISFNDIILDAALDVSKGELVQIYNDEDFQQPLGVKEVSARLGTYCVFDDPNKPGQQDSILVKVETSDIIQYMIIEDWFFDKQRSIMDVRIIGIAPIYQSFNVDPLNGCAKSPKEELGILFYIYFPQLRSTLARHLAFNFQNTAARMTWDDLFFKRMFGSVIKQEENVFDRRIEQYKVGLDALLEAEAIKERIFNYEQDLWEF